MNQGLTAPQLAHLRAAEAGALVANWHNPAVPIRRWVRLDGKRRFAPVGPRELSVATVGTLGWCRGNQRLSENCNAAEPFGSIDVLGGGRCLRPQNTNFGRWRCAIRCRTQHSWRTTRGRAQKKKMGTICNN